MRKNISIYGELHEKLRQASFKRRKPIAKLIEELVTKYL